MKAFESHPILSTNPMAATSGDSVISLQGSNGGLLCWLPPFSKVFCSFFSLPRFESVESSWLIEKAEGALAMGFVGTVLFTTAVPSSILSSLSLFSSHCAPGDVLSPISSTSPAAPVAHSTPLVQTSACDDCDCTCACSSCSSDLRLTGEFCWRMSASKVSVVFNFSSLTSSCSCDCVNCCLQSLSWCWSVKMVDCMPSTSSSSWITKSFNSKTKEGNTQCIQLHVIYSAKIRERFRFAFTANGNVRFAFMFLEKN